MIADLLPVLGIGASLSLSSTPDPVELVKNTDGPDFVEYAGLVDGEAVHRQVARIRHAGVPVLYHPSFINFCGTHANSEKWISAAARHIKMVKSAWFAQDCAYCFWQHGSGYSTQLGYFIPPILSRSSLDHAIDRIKEVQAGMPVPLAIEPPPMTFVVGSMLLFEFFGQLAEAVDCAILLDMGHLVSYEMASSQRIENQLSALPIERVIEVHVAGGKLRKAKRGPIYVDAHEARILPETWKMFEAMLPVLPNLHAICLECEGVEKSRVLPMLGRIRTMVKQYSASEKLQAYINGAV